jgi:hypothetical protein
MEFPAQQICRRRWALPNWSGWTSLSPRSALSALSTKGISGTFAACSWRSPAPPTPKTYENIYWVFGVVLDDGVPFQAAEAMRRLSAREIGTRPFFWTMHEQPVLRHIGLFAGEVLSKCRTARAPRLLSAERSRSERAADRRGRRRGAGVDAVRVFDRSAAYYDSL